MENYRAIRAYLILLIAVIIMACNQKPAINLTATMVKNATLLNIHPAFIPLPPGAVKAEGWIRDWAKDAAYGITGHLDEYSPTFGEAWKGMVSKPWERLPTEGGGHLNNAVTGSMAQ
jgi:hypothetical protein